MYGSHQTISLLEVINLSSKTKRKEIVRKAKAFEAALASDDHDT